MTGRELLEALAAGVAAGLPLGSGDALAADGDALYDIPRYGNVSLLHFTDCHAQMLPVHFREPDVNIGVAEAAGKPPHLVGNAFLSAYGIAPGTREAHAFTYLNYAEAAEKYGKVGGFAHLGLYINLMQGLGIIMILLFFHLYFAPWRRFRAALAPQDRAAPRARGAFGGGATPGGPWSCRTARSSGT